MLKRSSVKTDPNVPKLLDGMDEGMPIDPDQADLTAICEILRINGIEIKPEYLRPEMVDLIHQLHANQITIKDDYLTPVGQQYIRFLEDLSNYPVEPQNTSTLHHINVELSDATQSLWNVITSAREGESSSTEATQAHAHRFIDKKLIYSVDNVLGSTEKGADALGLSKTRFFQGLKVVRDLVILAKRMNDPHVDPMLVGADAVSLVLGKNTKKVSTKLSKLVDSALAEQDVPEPIEAMICSVMGGAAQLGVDYVFAGYFALYKIPQFAGSIYKVAAVRAGMGTAYGVTAQNTTDLFANTIGAVVKEASHNAFRAERERRRDGDDSRTADPETLHVGLPVHPRQAQVLGDAAANTYHRVKEAILSTDPHSASIMDGMDTGMFIDSQQARVLGEAVSNIYQKAKDVILSTDPSAPNLLDGMDAGMPIAPDQAKILGEKFSQLFDSAANTVKEVAHQVQNTLDELLSNITPTTKQNQETDSNERPAYIFPLLHQTVLQHNARDQLINPFAPQTKVPAPLAYTPIPPKQTMTPTPAPFTITPMPYQMHVSSTTWETPPWNKPWWERESERGMDTLLSRPLLDYYRRPDYVDSCVRSAVEMEFLTCCGRRPSGLYAYDRACREIQFCEMGMGMRLGSGYLLSMFEFFDIVRSNNLLLSYNGFNSEYGLRELEADFFGGVIGGVASEVALIQDLLDSEAQAEITTAGLHICLPKSKLPFDQSLVSQIYREVSFARRVHKTTPFFSLHFTNEADLYLIIHPAFKGTQIEKMLILLDYWMKGFLNGGIFDETFLLKTWHEAGCSKDETFLRAHLIDLKKYCRDDPDARAAQISYFSLRELMARHELEHPIGTSAKQKQPFQTSFRIIFSTTMQRKKNLLIPQPSFRVEYTIEESAEYKEFIEGYKKEHGHYPPDYQHIKNTYQAFAEEIKKTFPKLPFCAEYFKLFGLATAFSYVDITLEKMGKEPMLPPVVDTHNAPYPNKLPPIPVRYFKKLPITLTLEEVMEDVFKTDLEATLLNLLQEHNSEILPENLSNCLRQSIERLVHKKARELLSIPNIFEINDHEIDRFYNLANERLLMMIKSFQYRATELAKRSLFFLTNAERQTILESNTIDKLKQTTIAVNKFYDQLKVDLNATIPLTELDVAKKYPGVSPEFMQNILIQAPLQRNSNKQAIAEYIKVMFCFYHSTERMIEGYDLYLMSVEKEEDISTLTFLEDRPTLVKVKQPTNDFKYLIHGYSFAKVWRSSGDLVWKNEYLYAPVIKTIERDFADTFQFPLSGSPAKELRDDRKYQSLYNHVMDRYAHFVMHDMPLVLPEIKNTELSVQLAQIITDFVTQITAYRTEIINEAIGKDGKFIQIAYGISHNQSKAEQLLRIATGQSIDEKNQLTEEIQRLQARFTANLNARILNQKQVIQEIKIKKKNIIDLIKEQFLSNENDTTRSIAENLLQEFMENNDLHQQFLNFLATNDTLDNAEIIKLFPINYRTFIENGIKTLPAYYHDTLDSVFQKDMTRASKALHAHVTQTWATASQITDEWVLQALPHEDRTSYQNIAHVIKETHAGYIRGTIECINVIGLLNHMTQRIMDLGTERIPLPDTVLPSMSTKINELTTSLMEKIIAAEAVTATTLVNADDPLVIKIASLKQELVEVEQYIRSGRYEISPLEEWKIKTRKKIRMLLMHGMRLELMLEAGLASDFILFVFHVADDLSVDCSQQIKLFRDQSPDMLFGIRRLTIKTILQSSQDKITQATSNFIKKLQSPSAWLLAVESVHKSILTNNYMHTRMSFTNKDLIKETGDSFEIVGGCGVSLPNLQCKPIQHSDAFYQAATSALMQDSNGLGEFEFGGVSYGVFHLAVQNKPQLLVQQQNEAITCLAQLVETGTSEIPKTQKLIASVLDPSGTTFMHSASAALPLEVVTQLTEMSPAMIDAEDDFGNRPIHAATHAGHIEVVQHFIQMRPGLRDVVNKKSVTPLVIAVQSGQLEMVKYLLSVGSNANYRLQNGLFPLYISIQNNFIDIAHLLLPYLTPEQCSQSMDSGITPLHLAIKYGMLDLALALIHKGVALTPQEKSSGMTPFHFASVAGMQPAILAMMERSPDVKTIKLPSGKTGLHIAASAGHTSVVQVMIERRMDVNATTLMGDTPLTLAIANKQENAAIVLSKSVQTGIYVGLKKQTYSLQALMYAMPRVADQLFARGESPLITDKEGRNAIYYLARNGDGLRLAAHGKHGLHSRFQEYSLLAIAARFGHFGLVNELFKKIIPYHSPNPTDRLINEAVKWDQIGFLRDWIKKNPKVWAENATKSSFVQMAAESGATSCLTFFVKNVNYSPDRMHKLLLAALESSSLTSLEFLLNHPKVDINRSLNSRGDRAIHTAVRVGSRVMLELLLTRGANVTLHNGDGHTAFHLAIDLNDAFLLKRLFKLTAPISWPRDLPSIAKGKHEADIQAVFRKQMARMPKITAVTAASTARSANPVIVTGPALTGAQQQHFDGIVALLMLNEFESVISQWNPTLEKLFKSNQGGVLWKMILQRIMFDFNPLKTEKSSAEQLFIKLKQCHLDPSIHHGENNPLLGLLSTENDDAACYGIDLFITHFPEALAPLVLDTNFGSPQISITSILLTKKLSKTYMRLIEACESHVESRALQSSNIYHELVLFEEYELLKSLLQYKYNVDQRNAQWQTPLMHAASLGHVNMLGLLLHHGANVLAVDREGMNALHYAIQQKEASAALYLLPLYQQPNQADRRGLTPLTLAATLGVEPVVQYLCAEADYTQIFTHKGFNALHIAAHSGQTRIVEILVGHGFDVDCPVQSHHKRFAQSTALHLAALYRHGKTMCRLLELGASMDKIDRQGDRFIEYGIRSKCPDILRLIKQLPDYSQRAHQTSLLRSAVETDNHVVLCELMLAGADISIVEDNGFSLLHRAVIYNARECCNILVKSEEMSLDLYDKRNETALSYAARLGRVAHIELLIEAGASVNILNSEHVTPLYLSCEAGHRGAVVALLHYGADAQMNQSGITPAQIALYNGHVAIAARIVHERDDRSCDKTVLAQLPEPLKSVLVSAYPQLQKEIKQLSNMPRHATTVSMFSKQPVVKHARMNDVVEADEPTTLTTFLPTTHQVLTPGALKNVKTLSMDTQDMVPAPIDLDSALSMHSARLRVTQPQRMDHWSDFCDHLVRTAALTRSEKYKCQQIAAACFLIPAFATKDPAHFLSIVMRLKETFGSYTLDLLLSMRPTTNELTFAAYLFVFQLILDLRDDDNIFTIMTASKSNLEQLKVALQQQHLVYLDRKHPLREGVQLVSVFQQTKYPAPETQWPAIVADYTEIKNELRTLRALTLHAIVHEIQLCLQSFPLRDAVTVKPRLLALLIESLRKEPTIAVGLYDTQIFIVLIMLHYPSALRGRIAEVETGGGKSKIMTVLSAYLALHGYTVDVLTTTEDLASRDDEAYRAFYKALHIEENTIRYFTRTGPLFEMLGQLRHENDRGNRPHDVLLADEIDSLLIDEARNTARTAVQNRQRFSWVYEPIFNFVKEKASSMHIRDASRWIIPLRQYLESCATEESRYQVASFTDKKLTTWLSSAIKAIKHTHPDQDYSVRRVYNTTNLQTEDQIVIINFEHTGDLSEGSEWGGGLHQFLQVKHQISPTPESLTIGSSCPSIFYRYNYKYLFGLTGTIGNQQTRDVLGKLFLVDCCDMAPHFPNIREILPTQLAKNSRQHQELIHKRIQHVQRSGRPSLVLVKTIDSSKKLGDYLNQQGLTPQIYNGEQAESASYLVSKIGHPKMTTIATNVAGRGTDVYSLVESGLDINFTFYPVNVRVQVQGFGRAARNGKPGSAGMILSLEDPYFQQNPLLHRLKPKPNSKGEFKQSDVDEFMSHVTRIRDEDTQRSLEGLIGFTQRQISFNQKLQEFKRMNTELNALLNDPAFKARVIDFIESCDVSPQLLTEKHPLEWKQALRDQAVMLHQQSLRHVGAIFYQRFQKTYLDEVLYIWATFYDELDDSMSESEERNAYEKVQMELTPYFLQPEVQVFAAIADIYAKNTRQYAPKLRFFEPLGASTPVKPVDPLVIEHITERSLSIEHPGMVEIKGNIAHYAKLTIKCGGITIEGDVGEGVEIIFEDEKCMILAIKGNIGDSVTIRAPHAVVVIDGSIGSNLMLTADVIRIIGPPEEVFALERYV